MKKFVRLLSEKKAAYSEYKKIKKEMRDYQIDEQNVESFYAAQAELGHRGRHEKETGSRKDKHCGQSSKI